MKLEKNVKGLIANYIKTYNLNFNYTRDFKEFFEWYKYYLELDSSNRIMAVDIETKKLYPIDNQLLTIAVTYKDKNDNYESYCFNCKDLTEHQIILMIKAFNSLKSKKVLHNAYFDITTMSIMFTKFNWDYDTLIMYHSMLPHRVKDKKNNDFGVQQTGLSLKDLTRDFLTFGDYEQELEEFKKNYCSTHKLKVSDFTYDLIPFEVLVPYNCMDTLCTLMLFEKGLQLISAFEKTGFKKLKSILNTKHLVTDIYIDARIRGLKIDRDKIFELDKEFKEVMDNSMQQISTQFSEGIEYTERTLYKLALEKELMKDFEYIAEKRPKISKSGKEKWISKKVSITDNRAKKLIESCKFNINSSQHKAILFCDYMKLEPLEYSEKTKSPKCDIKFLEHYSYKGLDTFIDYGKSRTAINNFLGSSKDLESDDEIGKGDSKTLLELTSEEYPYVHSSYNLNGTVTGRCSCNSINLQQIPSKGVLKSLKKCFVARDNHYLVYADYSSAEVVILGSIIDSHIIKQSLANNWDLHSMNAWKMLKEDILKVHPDWEEKFKECGDDVDKLRDFYKGIKSEFEQTVRYRTKSLGN